MLQRQIFPRREHLRYGHQFRRVYEHGRKYIGRYMVLYAMPTPAADSNASQSGRAIGFVTSRKLGQAVIRNRARRLMREAYRFHRSQLPMDVHLVLVARSAIVGRTCLEVETEFVRLIRTAGLMNEP